MSLVWNGGSASQFSVFDRIIEVPVQRYVCNIINSHCFDHRQGDSRSSSARDAVESVFIDFTKNMRLYQLNSSCSRPKFHFIMCHNHLAGAVFNISRRCHFFSTNDTKVCHHAETSWKINWKFIFFMSRFVLYRSLIPVCNTRKVHSWNFDNNSRRMGGMQET